MKLAKKEAAPKKAAPAAKVRTHPPGRTSRVARLTVRPSQKTGEAKPKKAATGTTTKKSAAPKAKVPATKKATCTTKKAAAPKANTSTKRKAKTTEVPWTT